MKFTEDNLKGYAAPLSKTEDLMCKRAIEMIRDALELYGFTDENREIMLAIPDTYSYSLEMRNPYTNRGVKIFVQGSYANNTNVRTESDVDVAVVQEERFNTKYRQGVSDANYNFSTYPAPEKTFKDEVQEMLVNKFGTDVERKNKSIKVHGNTYRKDADTVPCLRYRDYSDDYMNNVENYIGGIIITADSGERIINYPEQHIQNGRMKNIDTNHYYKKMVRIMKKMRYIMQSYGYESANNVSSFGLESLLWNIPDTIFMKYSIYRYEFEEIIKYLLENSSRIHYYKEANGIKYLCPTQQDTDHYVRFLKDLSEFYEYDI